MDNETKLSPGQLQSLLAALQSNKNEESVDVNAFVAAEQASAARRLLQNPALVKTLLNSPQAKSLMEKFGKSPSDL